MHSSILLCETNLSISDNKKNAEIRSYSSAAETSANVSLQSCMLYGLFQWVREEDLLAFWNRRLLTQGKRR